MPIEFDIQVVNGCLKITVGGGQTTATRSDQGGGCCGPVVVGPIVVDASSMQSGMPGQNQQGGNSPGGASGFTGGGAPGQGGHGNGQNSPGGHGGHTGGGGPGKGGHGNGQSSPGGHGGHTGGGGPGSGSGSGCCCPVVIGPIVIGGCCSSQDPASSNADPGSKAVCQPPPTSAAVVAPTRPFTMQAQQASNWCWAAVAVSIYDFFNPPNNLGAYAGTLWTQGLVANKLLGITAPGCSQQPIPGSCNQDEALDAALTITQNLMPSGALFGQHFTFACIQSWVKAQIPLGVRIQWRGVGGHFIVLDGCKVLSSGRQLVHVQDPSCTANASHSLWDYDALVEDYREAGYWDSTYLVASKPTTS
jgi:hypothetical protein